MRKPAPSRLCSTLEFARLRGISRQRVLALLDAGRIAGAQWIGARWAVPRRRAQAGAGLMRGTPQRHLELDSTLRDCLAI